MRFIKKFVIIFTALFVIMANVDLSYGQTVLSKQETSDYLYKIAYYEQTHVLSPAYGSVDGEWLMMGLARYGALTKQYIETYKRNLKSTLKACGGVLSTRKYTEYARVVIALSALEEDVQNFDGYNLLRPLAEFDKIIGQGMNGVIYALIALDSRDYDIPEPQKDYTGKKTTRDRLVGYIVSNQTDDGGWNFAGAKADTDMTAMAIQALAPYYKKNDKVKTAIDRGLDCLGELQQSDGSYLSGTTKNCESTAQVLTAMSVMNIDVSDHRFVKNKKTILDGLMQYYNKSGGFCHLAGQDINHMATEQAMYALVAYYRSVSGRNGLYEMKDGITFIAINTSQANIQGESTDRKEMIKKEQKTKKEKQNQKTQTESSKGNQNVNSNGQQNTENAQDTDASIEQNKVKDTENRRKKKEGKRTKKEKKKKTKNKKNKKRKQNASQYNNEEQSVEAVVQSSGDTQTGEKEQTSKTGFGFLPAAGLILCLLAIGYGVFYFRRKTKG